MKAHVRQCDPSVSLNWHDRPPQEVRDLLQHLLHDALTLIVFLFFLVLPVTSTAQSLGQVETTEIEHTIGRSSYGICGHDMNASSVLIFVTSAFNMLTLESNIFRLTMAYVVRLAWTGCTCSELFTLTFSSV